MSMATELVLEAVRDAVTIVHLDTADRRDLSNVGKIDPANILLAAWHGAKYLLLLLGKNPDIVYVPIAQEGLAFLRDSLFLIPARLLRKKVIVHLHGGHFSAFYQSASLPMQRLVRYAIGKSDRAVVLGASLLGMFEGVVPQDRVRVIPNGVPDHFGEYVHRSCNGRRRTILFLSTLMKEKGALDVLGALPEIAKRVPNVQAVFAGEWLRAEEKRIAEDAVHDLKVESYVEFLGTVVAPRKYEVFRAADVFLMPTFYKNEGHPYVVLEAMSAGLPVVSTAAGCIPETVIDGVNGFIVKPGNRAELVDKVVRLLTDDDLRKRMGEASRKRFLELYTVERFADQMRSLFREVCTQDPVSC
jgi:glycosyltransferase involved in cell wall biosynthesis